MPSTCDIYGKTFAKPFNLRRHEREVHGHISNDDNVLMSTYAVLQHPFTCIVAGCTQSGKTIEIISNTIEGGIEGERIWERGDWGANSSPGCSLIQDVPDKNSRCRRVFLLFKLFFAVKILKISLQIV